MSTRVDRRFRGVVLVLATASISVFGTLIVEWAIGSSRPEVALTANLIGGSAAAASTRFDDRVRERFPRGSAERVLTMELAREGFRQIDFGGVTGTEHQADRDSPRGDLCVDSAAVYWRADPGGRIASIRGSYFQICP